MAIGIFEVVFCLIAFFVIWYFVFKILLMYEEKKLLKNLNKSLEKQEGKKFVIEGRIVNMGKEEPGEEEVIEPIKEKPKTVKTSRKKVVKKSVKKKK